MSSIHEPIIFVYVSDVFYVFSTMQKHKNAYCNSIENMSSLEKSNSSTIYDTALEIKAFIHIH